MNASATHQSFSSGLKWSVGAHLILIGIVLLKGIVLPRAPLRYIPTLKVDIVALPDVLKKDMTPPGHGSQFDQQIKKLVKQAEKQIEKRPEKAPDKSKDISKEMSLSPRRTTVEQRNKRALERLKALSKIQESVDKSSENDAPAIPVKGNKISKGLSLSGEAREAAESNYLEVLRERIQPNWNLPTWIDRLNLDAQVQVYIDARGRLRKFVFVKKSGHTQFDDLIVHAIQESQPFPFPPEDLQALLLTDGIRLGFPL